MSTPRSGPKKKRTPRELSARYLENAALHYLGRYPATVSQLRRVLGRKVDRELRLGGGDPEQARAWVEAVVEKLVRGGLVDDRAYATMKARSLRSAGRSARVIALTLRHKGVPPELVQSHLAEATLEISEEQAALTCARKKRLGPFRPDPETRSQMRQRDLAALARAGFDFDTARRVLEGPAQ